MNAYYNVSIYFSLDLIGVMKPKEFCEKMYGSGAYSNEASTSATQQDDIN